MTQHKTAFTYDLLNTRANSSSSRYEADIFVVIH